MKIKYKAICTLKENSKEYTIHRNLDNNRFYKEIDGVYEKLSLEDGKFYKGIEKINDKIGHDKKVKIRKENIRKATRFTSNAAILLLASTLLCTAMYASYVENTPKRDYKHSEKTENDIMDLFIKSMEKNSTSNAASINEMKKYLQVFIDECSNLGLENDEVYINIAKQLRVMDFNNKDSLSYKDLCEIFDFRNGKFIAEQLYSYFEDVSLDCRYNKIANYLYFNETTKKSLLSGKKIEIIIDGKEYSLNLKDITKNDRELFDALDKYVSQIVDTDSLDSCVFCSNIFSSILEEYYHDFGISVYHERQEDGTLLNVSYREYYKKLAKLIYTEGEELDYSNKTDRELLYLYVEALRLNFGYQYEKEPTSFILDTFLSSDDFLLPVIGSANFLRYLNGGGFSY